MVQSPTAIREGIGAPPPRRIAYAWGRFAIRAFSNGAVELAIDDDRDPIGAQVQTFRLTSDQAFNLATAIAEAARCAQPEAC